MTGSDGRDDTRAERFGAIDGEALRDVRDRFTDLEPLVERTTLDDPLNPQTLSVELGDGVGDADHARIDVRWSISDNYAAHYTDSRGRNYRFDCHPKPDAPRRHFHTPPDAPTRPVEKSCITVSEIEPVTRAVLDRWRTAYDSGEFESVNGATNPP